MRSAWSRRRSPRRCPDSFLLLRRPCDARKHKEGVIQAAAISPELVLGTVRVRISQPFADLLFRFGLALRISDLPPCFPDFRPEGDLRIGGIGNGEVSAPPVRKALQACALHRSQTAHDVDRLVIRHIVYDRRIFPVGCDQRVCLLVRSDRMVRILTGTVVICIRRGDRMAINGVQAETYILIDTAALRTVLIGAPDHRALQRVGLRRRCYHADAPLIAAHSISAALVERPACGCLVKTAVRIIGHHRIGMLAAYAEGFNDRLCDKRYIVAAGSGSACERLTGIVLTDFYPTIYRVVFYYQRLIIAAHAVGSSHRLCDFQRSPISRILRMILEHSERRRDNTGSQCRGNFLLIADAPRLCAVFRREPCRLQDTVPACGHSAVHSERRYSVIGDRSVVAVNPDRMKHRRMIAMILCDQCESLVLGDTDTGIALRIQAEGSTSSVRPPACLSSAFFSTSGSSLPRTDALRRIPRQAFGLK